MKRLPFRFIHGQPIISEQLDADLDMLLNLISSARHIVIPSFDTDETIIIGDGTIGITIPEEMNGYTLTKALASVYSPSTSGNINVQLRHSRAGTDTDLLTNEIIVLEDEYYGEVENINKIVYKGDLIFPDVDLAGDEALGLFTVLTFEE